MEFANTDKILKQFGDRVVKLSRLNLKATRTRYRMRSTYRGGQVTSKQRKAYKGKISASGALARSLKYDIKGKNKRVLAIEMNDYGLYVDQGRKAGNVKRGVLKEWLKKLKPRKFVKQSDGTYRMGGFAPKTKANMKAMEFMISRKLKHHGYDKTEFFTEPFDGERKKVVDKLAKAVADDIELNLK